MVAFDRDRERARRGPGSDYDAQDRPGVTPAWGSASESSLPVRKGMRVLGEDGAEVGTVKEVRSGDFLVDRPLARDVYIPFDAMWTVGEDYVTLNVASGRLEEMGWAHPELTRASEDREQTPEWLGRTPIS